MESAEKKQKKQRKREESTALKRKKLTEEHESSLSEEEDIPITKKKKQLEETSKKKRKEQIVLEGISPEASPLLAKKKEREKRKKKEKQKKKEKEPIASIVEDGPQLDESAHAHHESIAKDVSFRLLVPSTDLGKVIGPHGSRIQQLREDTGALIKIGDAIMNLSERLVWISSKEDSLKSQSAAERALLRVATLLMEPSNEDEEIAKLRLLIAGSQADSMVDGAGVVMSKISENTGAIATILKKGMFPLLALASETDRLVQLEGQVSEVLKALELIAIRLRQRPPRTITGGNGRKNGGAFKARVEIRIPNDLTGKLIGKNGATIQQLQQQCGVSLEVGEEKEGGKYRTVHLRGMLSQVTMAQTLLQVFLASKQKAR